MSDDAYSDDEYYDDEYYYIDEGPVTEADDLAEHTMPSPLLINADPGWAVDDYSGWEYDTDDFYDELPPPANKPDRNFEPTKSGSRGLSKADRTLAATDSLGKRKRDPSPVNKTRKRRRYAATLENGRESSDIDMEELDTEIAQRALLRPVIVWREENNDDVINIPLFKEDEGSRVALLKDWKERFKGRYSNIQSGKDFKPKHTKSVNQEALEPRRGTRSSGKHHLEIEDRVGEKEQDVADENAHKTASNLRKSKRLKNG